MPWRNGLGTTVELCRQDLEDGSGFLWRLSMADVSQDGEFSNFTGYDRNLVLLDGKGLTLDCGDRVHRLEEPLQVAHFSGEAPTIASLHDGPIRDFNIMTLRRLCHAEVFTQALSHRTQLDIDTDLLLVYAVDAALNLESRHCGALQLPARHLLRLDKPGRQSLHCDGAGFIAVQISRKPQAS